MKNRTRFSALGCCVVDYLYAAVDFSGPRFTEYGSKAPGDGGLVPGKLVFTGDLEQFAGVPAETVVHGVTGGSAPSAVNIGGPAIVGAIHTAQLLGDSADVRFYGLYGTDEIGDTMIELIRRFPVNLDGFRRVEGKTPSTFVLSDPRYRDGAGERLFINRIGVSWDMLPESLPPDFFTADIMYLGATAVFPHIHRALETVLSRGRRQGALTVVATVFDFLSEKVDPDGPWPYGSGEDAYAATDLLITDREEALRLTGTDDIEAAGSRFIELGLPAFLITQGTEDVYLYAGEGRFFPTEPVYMPISRRIRGELHGSSCRSGDTTGCGDNFTGGVLASLSWQMSEGGAGRLDLREAAAWGVVSGGFACFSVGGAYEESRPGEKLEKLKPYYEAYLEQIRGQY